MHEPTARHVGIRSIALEIATYTLIAIAIVIPVRIFVAQPFIISGASMVPTFHVSDYVVIDLLSYRLRDPERGDVMVFRYPFDPSVYFVKRIVGLPGETVEIENGVVTVRAKDGTLVVLDEPYIAAENRTHESNVTEIDEDEYFVLGDNRSGSSDSRVWGPLQKKFVLGRVLMRLYPFDSIGFLPGRHDFGSENP